LLVDFQRLAGAGEADAEWLHGIEYKVLLGKKAIPRPFFPPFLVCQLCLHLFSMKSGLLVEYEVRAAEAGRPAWSWTPAQDGLGGTKMHGFFVIFGLHQKIEFICLPSAGQLHSTVFDTQM
jgi:hypothetical protein